MGPKKDKAADKPSTSGGKPLTRQASQGEASTRQASQDEASTRQASQGEASARQASQGEGSTPQGELPRVLAELRTSQPTSEDSGETSEEFGRPLPARTTRRSGELLMLSRSRSITQFDFITKPLKVGAPVHVSVTGIDEFNNTLGSAAYGGYRESLSTEDDDVDEASRLYANPYLSKALKIIEFRIGMSGWGHNFNYITRPFKPVMAHQIFGTEEVIFGYTCLHVVFYILPNSFNILLKMSYDRIRENPMRGEVPDSIPYKMKDWFPHLLTNEEEFRTLERSENMNIMYGTTIATFTFIDGSRTSNIFINQCTATDEAFVAFHKRFSSMIVFFIDAASIIDSTDPAWDYYYMYMEVELPNKRKGFIPIGFCTTYIFGNQRGRISQQFMLPNFQAKGLGKRLLGAVYKSLCKNEKVEFITVESPCEAFTIMRDKLDLQLLMDEPAFTANSVLHGFSPLMEKTAKEICKMAPRQSKHIFFLLMCYYARNNSTNYTRFKQAVKRDLHERYKRKFARLHRSQRHQIAAQNVYRIIHDNPLNNERIRRDFRSFVRNSKPQLCYIKLKQLMKVKSPSSLT